MDRRARGFLKKLVKNKHGKKFAAHGIKTRRGEKKRPCKASVFRPSCEPPSRVDLRKYCSPVEDQSQSNSCCANAAVGAYEYLCWREAMANGDTPGDISRLFVYYVGRLRDKQLWHDETPIADEGMSLTGAIDALTMKGACLQASFPFNLEDINRRPPQEAFEEAMNYKISEAKEIPCDLMAMRACLAEGFPIIFGLKLTQRFFNPGSTGRIATPDPSDPKSAEHGLHAMLMVGYSDHERCFIVRNSWGESWADKGYCYIPYDYAANEEFNFLGMYAIYGLTETDFTPDSTPDHTALFDHDVAPSDAEYEVEEEEEEVHGEGELDGSMISDLFDPLKEARRAFDKFDRDHSGSLDMKELNRALRCNGTKMKHRRLKKIMRIFDRDGSGTLSFDEFIRIPGVLPPEMGGVAAGDSDDDN